MAHEITAHTIINGSRNLIVQFNIESDGASGQYSDYTLLDLTDYTGGDQKQPNNYKIMKVSGRNGAGTSFQLKFGNTAGTHKLFFESVAENEFFEDWSEIGGLSPLLANPDMTIRLTTLGFDASGDTMSLLIWLKKKTQNPGQ